MKALRTAKVYECGAGKGRVSCLWRKESGNGRLKTDLQETRHSERTADWGNNSDGNDSTEYARVCNPTRDNGVDGKTRRADDFQSIELSYILDGTV